MKALTSLVCTDRPVKMIFVILKVGSVPSQTAGNRTNNSSLANETDYLSQQISDYVTSEYECLEQEKKESESLTEKTILEDATPSSHQLLTNFQENIDVVIVGNIESNALRLELGAGPVGLWTAIQIKTMSPNARIVVLEKHEKYKRHHVLRLSKSELMPDHPTLAGLLKEFPSVIRTSALEERLYQYSVQIGITKFYYHVEDPNELHALFPQATIFIGADGAGSVMRERLFGGIGFTQTLRCLAFFKYEVEGAGRSVSDNMTQFYAVLKMMNHIVTEHVGTTRDGKTPITCQIFVSEEEHNVMANAKFSNPFIFPRDVGQLQPDFLKSLTIWLNYKMLYLEEKRVAGSETLVSIKLNNYKARQVALSNNGKFYFLVGDAASGIPFFRALNFGFICSNKLSLAVSDILSPQLQSKDEASPKNNSLKLFPSLSKRPKIGVKGYQVFFDDAVAFEFSKSNMKSRSIDIGDSFLGIERRINAIVPSSLVLMKFPREECTLLESTNAFPGGPEQKNSAELAVLANPVPNNTNEASPVMQAPDSNAADVTTEPTTTVIVNQSLDSPDNNNEI